MPATLNDFNTAVRLHSIITKIITRHLKKSHPPARYGVVQNVYLNTFRVDVLIGKDTNTTPITCPALLIPSVGSYVRIEGPDSDLVITQIMSGTNLSYQQDVSHTDCVIRYTDTQPLRNTATSDLTRRVRWVAPAEPSISDGYAIEGDIWEKSP